MKFTQTELRQMANMARARALYGIRRANSGHIGMVLGAADIITALYAVHLNFDPANPTWAGRDRFVLSAGHASALLYSVLGLAGYDIPNMSAFRKFKSPLAGHPEYGECPGVETSTGPLGQGVANAVGMALAARIKRESWTTYCLCGDGDLMEGVVQEAIAFAGREKLANFILLWDDNNISIDGIALTDIDMCARMAAAGFDVFSVDGNNPKQVVLTIARAKKSKRPAFIRCRTTIGLGSSVAGTPAAHGLSIPTTELELLETEFTTKAGEKLWKKTGIKSPNIAPKKVELNLTLKTPALLTALRASDSTRALSGKILNVLCAQNPTLIGGSADLADSTCTRPKSAKNFIDYGVREHAMAAIMNGLALTGLRPYGGTFLVFCDYMRAAMRMSAMMYLPVVYVLTHDSVAVGEDGPTHQPVEQIASLRLMPNMNVIRPADGMETAAAWQMALSETTRPTCIILSRQKLPALSNSSAEKATRGAYIIRENPKNKVTLIATGSEVSLALAVADILEKNKVATTVVSAPCVEKFRMQRDDYRRKILTGMVVAIEAGTPNGWYEFADAVMGIDEFGRGGTGAEVYKSFGFDAENIANEIIKST